MRQSNLYMVIYAAVLTIVCGGLLALASEGLKEKQEANVALEQKQNILATVINLKEGDDVLALYGKKVNPIVVDYNGNVIAGKKPEDINVAAEYKKPVAERQLPVYEFKNEKDPTKTDYVVLPVYGYGLWNNIWGFVALESDLNTLKGVKFKHAGETPGLGARIADDQGVQDRFVKKKIFDDKGNLASVTMMKGEGADYSNDAHKVDGMSGATLTGKGLNNMLRQYFECYQNYLKKKQK